MAEPTEQFEHNGFVVKVYPDECCQDDGPRDWDNLGVMACLHRQYNLGDDCGLTSVDEIDQAMQDGQAVSLPLYLYDHSGLRMKVGSFQGLLPQGHAEFDSGQVGYIFATAEAIRKEYSCKRITASIRKKVLAVLEQEVQTYDQYLSGDVWGYVIEDRAGEHIDSCWGFYGFDYCMQEAKDTAEAHKKPMLVWPSTAWLAA